MNFKELETKMVSKFPNHSESTIKIRINCTKRVMKECFGVSTFDFYYYENVRDFKQWIYSFDNKSVRKNLTAGLYKSLQAIDSDLTIVYKNFYHKMASESDDERIYKKPTKQEIAQQKTWEELVQIRKDLFLKRDKSDNAFMRYLIASLYTKLPPLFQEEWIGAVFSDNGSNNYLH